MYVCIYMYVCMYVCIMYLCMYVCMYVYMHVICTYYILYYMDACNYVRTCVFMYNFPYSSLFAVSQMFFIKYFTYGLKC